MADIRQFLDSTYLQTAQQDGLSDFEHKKKVELVIRQAIQEQFKLVMVRPEFVGLARTLINRAKSPVLVGTVIDFPHGGSTLKKKLTAAKKAMADGADELDFVCNYKAFKKGKTQLVQDEISACVTLCLTHGKTSKWIIEVAALNILQIAQLSALIKNVVMSQFKESDYNSVFVKSSTGFYPTKSNLPNGATWSTVVMMLENASPLPVKASGGVRSLDDAVHFINLGVKRIGTSSAKAIVSGHVQSNAY